MLFGGFSAASYDAGEADIRAESFLLRGGVRLPAVDLSLVGERWGDWANQRTTSVMVEANYYPFKDSRMSPFVVLGVGSIWGDPVDAALPSAQMKGASTSFGLGTQLRLIGRSAARIEFLLRDDDDTFNSQVRLSAGYAAAPPSIPEDAACGRLNVGVYQLSSLRGPWEFVEPGYMMRYSRPYSQRFGAALSLGVFHWRDSRGMEGGRHSYDTRAIVGMPSLLFMPLTSDLLTLRAGPAIIAMGEGHDAGSNLGAQIEASTVVRPFSVPIELGVGSLWMRRGAESNQTSGEDQLGLSFFGGLHF